MALEQGSKLRSLQSVSGTYRHTGTYDISMGHPASKLTILWPLPSHSAPVWQLNIFKLLTDIVDVTCRPERKRWNTGIGRYIEINIWVLLFFAPLPSSQPKWYWWVMSTDSKDKVWSLHTYGNSYVCNYDCNIESALGYMLICSSEQGRFERKHVQIKSDLNVSSILP